MRIAVPMRDEKFCEHFGRADSFFLCDIGLARRIERPRVVARAKPACERVPEWLKSMGVTTILAGGVGAVAQHHCEELGISVCHGSPHDDPLAMVRLFLSSEPSEAAVNPCSSMEHRHHHCHG